MSSLLLSNGHIVDGTGRPVFQGDVQIEGNNIVKVTKSRAESRGEELDISGLFICPGFIDMHSHSDFFSPVLALSGTKPLFFE